MSLYLEVNITVIQAADEWGFASDFSGEVLAACFQTCMDGFLLHQLLSQLTFSCTIGKDTADHCSESWSPSLEAMEGFFKKLEEITFHHTPTRHLPASCNKKKKKFQLLLAVRRQTGSWVKESYSTQICRGKHSLPTIIRKKVGLEAWFALGEQKKTQQSSPRSLVLVTRTEIELKSLPDSQPLLGKLNGRKNSSKHN